MTRHLQQFDLPLSRGSPGSLLVQKQMPRTSKKTAAAAAEDLFSQNGVAVPIPEEPKKKVRKPRSTTRKKASAPRTPEKVKKEKEPKEAVPAKVEVLDPVEPLGAYMPVDREMLEDLGTLFAEDYPAPSTKDDASTMDLGFFSLTSNVKNLLPGQPLRFARKNGEYVLVTPSPFGMPSIMDLDLLIFLLSKIQEHIRQVYPHTQGIKSARNPTEKAAALNRRNPKAAPVSSGIARSSASALSADEKREILKRRTIEFNTIDFLRSVNRAPGGKSYAAVYRLLNRLAGTLYQTSRREIEANDEEQVERVVVEGFHIIDNFKIIAERKTRYNKKLKDGMTKGRRVSIPKSDQETGEGAIRFSVTLNEWFVQHAIDKQILTLSDDFFDLKPIERCLYRIARKALGRGANAADCTQRAWSLDDIYEMSACMNTLREFEKLLKKFIKGQLPSEKNGEMMAGRCLPDDYYFAMDEEKKLIYAFRGKTVKERLSGPGSMTEVQYNMLFGSSADYVSWKTKQARARALAKQLKLPMPKG